MDAILEALTALTDEVRGLRADLRAKPRDNVLACDDLSVDLIRRVVVRGDVRVRVVGKQFDLLAALARDPSAVVTRAQLAAQVWDYENPTDIVITKTVSYLRAALNFDVRRTRLVHSVHGVGYRLLPT